MTRTERLKLKVYKSQLKRLASKARNRHAQEGKNFAWSGPEPYLTEKEKARYRKYQLKHYFLKTKEFQMGFDLTGTGLSTGDVREAIRKQWREEFEQSPGYAKWDAGRKVPAGSEPRIVTFEPAEYPSSVEGEPGIKGRVVFDNGVLRQEKWNFVKDEDGVWRVPVENSD